MKLIKTNFLFVLLLFFSLSGCSRTTEDRNVEFFKDTKAYELTKAVAAADIEKIERLVKADSALLKITNSVTGSNVLELCLYVEQFESFKKLLELGADPNFINPYTTYNVLINACKFYYKPEAYTIDLRYIKLLLKFGANPNYAVEEEFTDEKGNHHLVNSPLMEAAKLNLEMVKILIKHGADPHKKLGNSQKTPFASSLTGFKDRFIIISYFIDTLNVDVHQSMLVRSMDSLYVQDYIKKFMSYKEGTDEDRKKQDLIDKLKIMGVDFDNYVYKLK